MRLKHVIVLGAFILLLGTGGRAYAQQNPYSLDMKVYKNTQALNDLRDRQAQLYLKVENLLVQYGEIKGQLQNLSHRLTRIEKLLDSTIGKALQRLQVSSTVMQKKTTTIQPKKAEKVTGLVISKKIASIQNNIKKKQSISKVPPLPVQPADVVAYKNAKKVYNEGKYSEAIKTLEKFKKDFPKSQLIPNAIFYIAQSYYKLKQYDRAIINYDYLINTYPNTEKAVDATLKEGMSFILLGDKVDGKYLLQKVMQQYPNTNQAKIAKSYLKKLGG